MEKVRGVERFAVLVLSIKLTFPGLCFKMVNVPEVSVLVCIHKASCVGKKASCVPLLCKHRSSI